MSGIDRMNTDNVAIRVQNLSKCYEIYASPRDRLKQFIVPTLCRAIPALRKLFPSINHQPSTAFSLAPAFLCALDVGF